MKENVKLAFFLGNFPLNVAGEQNVQKNQKGKLSFTFPETRVGGVSLRSLCTPSSGRKKGHLIAGGFPYTCPLPMAAARLAELYFKGPAEKDKQVTEMEITLIPEWRPPEMSGKCTTAGVIKSQGATAELSGTDREEGHKGREGGRK